MRPDVLYFPHIEISNIAWLKSAMLMWDRVYRIVPNGYVPNDCDEVKRAIDAGIVRAVNLETDDIQRVVKDFKSFMGNLEFLPAGLDDYQPEYLHHEKIDAHLYPLLEKHARGESDGWIELPREIVRGYMFFLSNQVAKRRNLSRCTDNKFVFGVSPYFSENANISSYVYDRGAELNYSALIFNDVLPFSISHVPMESIIKISSLSADEKAAFRHEIEKFTDEMCECDSKDHADAIFNDFKGKLICAKDNLRKSQGLFSAGAKGSLFTMGVPTSLTAYGALLSAGADPFGIHAIGASIFIGAVAAYQNYKLVRSASKNPCGAGYLIAIEDELSSGNVFPAFDRYMEEFIND